MAITTNPKPTIYRNLYENTGSATANSKVMNNEGKWDIVNANVKMSEGSLTKTVQ